MSSNPSSAVPDEAAESTYWLQRRHQRYYKQMFKWVRRYGRHAESVLDVGSNNCEYTNWLDWIPYRERVDRARLFPLPGVVNTQKDFMEYEPGRVFDVVICMQVIEHLADPAPFCRKLLATGKMVLISVPYQWPPGTQPDHVHDPVDEAKLLNWAGRPWLTHIIVSEGRLKNSSRLMALFAGDACPWHQKLRLRWKLLRSRR